MSLRPVKRVLTPKDTLEGAGVRLKRAFGFGNTEEFDPFLLFDDFRNERASPGIRIAASRRSRTSWPARSITATAWAIKAACAPGTSSG